MAIVQKSLASQLELETFVARVVPKFLHDSKWTQKLGEQMFLDYRDISIQTVNKQCHMEHISK